MPKGANVVETRLGILL